MENDVNGKLMWIDSHYVVNPPLHCEANLIQFSSYPILILFEEVPLQCVHAHVAKMVIFLEVDYRGSLKRNEL